MNVEISNEWPNLNEKPFTAHCIENCLISNEEVKQIKFWPGQERSRDSIKFVCGFSLVGFSLECMRHICYRKI